MEYSEITGDIMYEGVRVAICQPYVILGGRLQVILAIIHALNEIGVVPDILTFGLKFDLSEMERSYNKPVQFNVKLIKPRPRRVPQDISILLFNSALKLYSKPYDLLVNSGNSSIFFDERKPVLHYFHFPREKRITAKVPDLHHPEESQTPHSIGYILRKILQTIYRLSKLHDSDTIVCNSAFTHNSLMDVYGSLPPNTSIIYPPVKLSEFYATGERRLPRVATLGRFGPEKRQLEQIQIAEKFPHIPFHIIGFVAHHEYFQRCLDYVNEKQLKNVHLHPNAKHEEMIALLRMSKYFLHLTINEPFGITTVQAFAAGCIPIVHDSGGQRESVIDNNLRFTDIKNAIQAIKFAETLTDNELEKMRMRLLTHAKQNFDEAVFINRMSSLLSNMISSVVGSKAL